MPNLLSAFLHRDWRLTGVMEGGPDGLRRAFRIFDSDMSGDISYGTARPYAPAPHR